jgi:hypothetical protein
MAVHTLDPAAFRAIFPAYANVVTFPDARLQAYWDLAVSYMGDVDGCLLSGAGLQSALNFLTAHLLWLAVLSERGQSGGVVTGSTVDKVQVMLAAPPFKDGWEFWLSQTPYGLQLWALLKVKSAGGFYIGGSPERLGFRRVGGGFGPVW